MDYSAAQGLSAGQASRPTPERLFETVNAYQRTAALRGAIELEVFTAVGEGATSARAIAARCRASERGTRILCDYLTVFGHLVKRDGHYELTPESAAFLDRRSTTYLGDTVRFMNDERHMAAFRDVAGLVRKGGTLLEGQGSVEPDNPIWVEFASSMAPLMAPAAEALARLAVDGHGGRSRVLDIAAGHGLFGIAVARRNPLAEVAAVDSAAVLELARENARSAGVLDRYRALPGDALSMDFGGGYDLVLVTNFLHHFDLATCERFMSKVRKALQPGGRAITLEFVPNEDRVSPAVAASFSLMMLGSTPAGDAYTFKELEGMLRRAGFDSSELLPVENSLQHFVVSRT